MLLFVTKIQEFFYQPICFFTDICMYEENQKRSLSYRLNSLLISFNYEVPPERKSLEVSFNLKRLFD